MFNWGMSTRSGSKICAVITKKDRPCELPALREVDGKRVCRTHASQHKRGLVLKFTEEKAT